MGLADGLVDSQEPAFWGELMGMFDEVLCNHDLFSEHKGEKHQTKSLDLMGGALELYEITPSGRLEFLDYEVEDHSDPDAQGTARLRGLFTKVFTGKRRDMNYHGWLDLSCFGRAKFTDGTLVAFEPEPASGPGEDDASFYEAPLDDANQTARRVMQQQEIAFRVLAEDSSADQPGDRKQVIPAAAKPSMTVGELIEKLRAFELDSPVLLQIDSRNFVPPIWVGVRDTAGIFDDEDDFQLVVSAWEPDAYLKPTPGSKRTA
jgi:hypothetical protein